MLGERLEEIQRLRERLRRDGEREASRKPS
jgi:hypothetical protein